MVKILQRKLLQTPQLKSQYYHIQNNKPSLTTLLCGIIGMDAQCFTFRVQAISKSVKGAIVSFWIWIKESKKGISDRHPFFTGYLIAKRIK